MRQLISYIFVFALLPIAVSPAQDNNKLGNTSGNIMVLLTGFENDHGNVKLCLCRSEDEQNGKIHEFSRASTEIKNKRAKWILKDIPYGRYSIKAFHDENGNGKLDTNFLGVPMERYGFSNNARGRFGPPPFAEAAFTLNSPQIKIEIDVK